MKTKLTLGLAVIAATGIALSGCAVSADSGEKKGDGGSGGSLVFASFGGDFQDKQIKAWQEPFTEETGVVFENDAVDVAKLKAMVDAGKTTWDLADVGLADAPAFCEDYLEPLDFSVIDKSAYPEGTVTDCGVPAYSFNQIMLYNTDAFGDNPPASAADYFDLEKYPGKRILPPELTMGILEFTLLADGVEPDDLYPLDVDRALAKLDTIKSELIFTTSYGEVQQALESQQADMVLSLTARAVIAIEGGAPYAPVWDGVVVNSDSIVIPKGAPNKGDAMKFIASLAGEDRQKNFAELSGMAPFDSSVKPDWTETQTFLDPVANGYDALVYSDASWWAENRDAVTEKYTAWQIG